MLAEENEATPNQMPLNTHNIKSTMYIKVRKVRKSRGIEEDIRKKRRPAREARCKEKSKKTRLGFGVNLLSESVLARLRETPGIVAPTR